MKVIDPIAIDANAPATFTRAGTAWYWDYAGTLQSAGTDVLRFHWSKADASYLGVLIEAAATNLLLNNATLTTQTVTVTNGASYTLGFYGTGAVTLSGAGTGTITGTGSSILTTHTFTASSGSLTLTVSGSVNGATVGSVALTTASLSTQTRTVSSAAQYTLSFYGSGSIVLSGAAATTVTGTSATVRTTYTFSAVSTSLTLTVSGSVTYAQLETGASASSVIVTAGAAVTRPADSVSGYGTFYNGYADATAAYNAGTAYALADVIQYGGRLYESLQAANTGHTPDTSATWWLDTGPNNVTAAFDGQVSTVATGSSQEESICLRLSENADGMALFGLVNVSYVHAIIGSGLMTGQQILYESGYPSHAVLQTTEAAAGNIVTITMNSGSGVVFPGVGEIVVGDVVEIGETDFGAGLALIDFSRKTTDEFGVTTFVERAFAKRLTASVLVEKANFNTVNDLLFSLRATPTVWIPSDDADYSSAIVYGFLRDMRAVIAYPTASLYSLEIEGLT